MSKTGCSVEFFSMNFITSEIGTPENRYGAANRGGYSNPTFDRTYDRTLVTLDLDQRQGMIADMLKLLADDVVVIPIYYDPDIMTGAFRTAAPFVQFLSDAVGLA